MNAVTIDTLAISKRLRSSGYSQEQAEAQASVLAEIIDEKLVTKDYLRRELQELDYRLTIKLGGMLVVAISIITGLLKVVH